MSFDTRGATGALPDDTIELLRFAHRRGERSELRLREVLAGCLGCEPAAVPLERGPHGRPQWATGSAPVPGFGFSASHSGDWLVLALAAGTWPGVDVQACTPRPSALALAQRHFTVTEVELLAGLDGAARLACFYRLWVAREAVLKALGRGLAFGLDRLQIDPDPQAPSLLWLDGEDAVQWQLRWIDLPAGYAGAVAWRGVPRELREHPPAPAPGPDG